MDTARPIPGVGPVALVLLLALACLAPSLPAAEGPADGATPPETVVRHAEDDGTIVHIHFFRKDPPREEADKLERLRALIRETVTSLGRIPCPACKELTPKTAHYCCWCGKPVSDEARQREAAEEKQRQDELKELMDKAAAQKVPPKPKPRAQPAGPDYTTVPNQKNEILCPAPGCRTWNAVTELYCQCGAALRDTPEIRARREAVLAEQRMWSNLAASATAPTAEPTAEPTEAPKPSLPYGPCEALIVKLDKFQKFAHTKLVQTGVPALPDLTLALKDPNPAIAKGAAGVLKEIVTPENARQVVQALRSDGTRGGAMIALEGAGMTAAPALFAELEDDRPESASFVVTLIGKLGAPAVPEIQKRLTPAWVRIFPKLGDALAAIGTPSVPVLVEHLVMSEDDYLVKLAATTLARIGKPAGDPLLARLPQERRLDRKKRVFEVLGQIRAANAVQAMVPFLRRGSIGIDEVTRKALSQIGTKESLTVLADFLNTGNAKEQQDMVDLMCTSPGPKLEVFCDLLGSQNWRIRQGAVLGLGKLRTDNAQVRRALEQARKDGKRQVRDAAEAVIKGLN